jgi:hypothetical protein
VWRRKAHLTERPKFNTFLIQLHQLDAWGGRTHGRNPYARKALVQALPPFARPRMAPRGTAAEAIRSLDTRFPWLLGAEKQMSRNRYPAPGDDLNLGAAAVYE